MTFKRKGLVILRALVVVVGAWVGLILVASALILAAKVLFWMFSA